MTVIVTVLADNIAGGMPVRAEHGLAILVQKDTRSFLFDTGASGLFLENAQTLDIDLGCVDTVVLSHGHYDHTGGCGRSLVVRTLDRPTGNGMP